jgi:hypothetical protein
MGPYSTEVRSRSFYLTRTDSPAGTVTLHGRYEVTVPVTDAPAILAALDQVTGHPQWSRWQRPTEGDEADTTWTLPPDGDGPAADPEWAVTVYGGSLTIRGPWIVHHEADRHLLDAEIAYWDVTPLRSALLAAADPQSTP